MTLIITHEQITQHYQIHLLNARHRSQPQSNPRFLIRNGTFPFWRADLSYHSTSYSATGTNTAGIQQFNIQHLHYQHQIQCDPYFAGILTRAAPERKLGIGQTVYRETQAITVGTDINVCKGALGTDGLKRKGPLFGSLGSARDLLGYINFSAWMWHRGGIYKGQLYQ